MRVDHPFKIPASIDNVSDDEAAVEGIRQLRSFVRGLLFADHGNQYWGYIFATVAILVFSCIVAGSCLVLSAFKGNKQFFVWKTLYRERFEFVRPTAMCVTSICGAIASLWYILFAVHRFRLDALHRADELRGSLFWPGIVLLPIFSMLYMETMTFIRRLTAGFLRSSTAQIFNLGTLCKAVGQSVLYVLPIVLALSIGFPTWSAQQKLNNVLPRVGQFLSLIDETLIWYEHTNSSYAAVHILRRYEEEAIGIWTELAIATDQLRPTFLLWTIAFGSLFFTFGAGCATLLWDKGGSHLTERNTEQARCMSSSIVCDDKCYEACTQQQFDLLQLVGNTAAPAMVFPTMLYSTVRLSYHASMAAFAGLMGHFLVVLSFVVLLASAACIARSIVKFHADRALPYTKEGAMPSIGQGSVHSDATLK